MSTRDGIPADEQARIIAELTYTDEMLEMEDNLNHGTCAIRIWTELGEGVLIGKTSRTVWHRTQCDDTLQFTGMSPGRTTQFWEVKASLRGRRIIVPLDALEVIDG